MIVDVTVLRPSGAGMDVLCLHRAHLPRAGVWEAVHGHIEEHEHPVDAAVRELREETGLRAERLYNLSRVESYYSHLADVVELIPAFCAIVRADATATLSAEHDAAEWLAPQAASARFAWPRERRALADALALLGRGDAADLEDVLRVR